MLDFLADAPVWRRVGFYDVCNTPGYHSDSRIDKRIDTEVVQAYARVRDKIVALDHSCSLDEVLDARELDDLARFIHVHLIRNPLASYRRAMHELWLWSVDKPRRPLPWLMPVPIKREVRKFRSLFRKGGWLTAADKDATIVERVRGMILEDGHAHLGLRSHVAQDRVLEGIVDASVEVGLTRPRIVYSNDELYTMDNPFALEGDGENNGLALAISPHHLVVAGDDCEPDVCPLERIAHLPYISFSTKLLAARPCDVRLLALCAVNPESGDSDVQDEALYRFLPVDLVGIPVEDRFTRCES